MEENDLICLPDPDQEQVSDQSKIEHFGQLPTQASTRAPTRRVGGNRPSRHQAAQHADPPAAVNRNNLEQPLEQPNPSSTIASSEASASSTPLQTPTLASPQQQLGSTTTNNIQHIQALQRGRQARASVAVKKEQKEQKKRQHYAKQEKERRTSAAMQLQRQIRGMLARKSYVTLRQKEKRRREKLAIEHNLQALREKRKIEKEKERKRVEQEMTKRNEMRKDWLRCQKEEEEEMNEKKKVIKEKNIKRKVVVEGMDKEERQGREERKERKLPLSSSPPFFSTSSSSSTSTSTSSAMRLPDFSNEFSHLSPSEALDIFVELTKEKETKQTLLTNLLQQERAASTRVNMLSRSIQEKKRRIQKLKIPFNPEKKREELENIIKKSKEKIIKTKMKNESHRQEMKSKIQQLRDLVETKKREFARIMEQVEMKKIDEEEMNQMLGIAATLR